MSTSVSASASGSGTYLPLSTNAELKLTGVKIRSLIDNLSGIPDYVLSLERKIEEMQKLDEIKSRRIRELEREVEM
jgi:hypothetical protein